MNWRNLETDDNDTSATAVPNTAPQTNNQGIAALTDQLRKQWSGDWNISGIDRANELANILYGKGVKDISGAKLVDTGWKPTDVSQMLYPDEYNPYQDANFDPYGLDHHYQVDFGNGVKFGNQDGHDYLHGGKGNNELAWSAEGHGAVGYSVVPDANGQLHFVPNWNSSSDANDIQGTLKDAATVATMMATMGGGGTALGSQLGLSGATATGAGNALISGANGLVQGQDPSQVLKNMAVAGATPVISSNISPYINDAVSGVMGADANPQLLNAVQNAAKNMGTALLTGRDVGAAALGSLGGSALGAALPDNSLTQQQAAALVNAGITASKGQLPNFGGLVNAFGDSTPNYESVLGSGDLPTQPDVEQRLTDIVNSLNSPEYPADEQTEVLYPESNYPADGQTETPVSNTVTPINTPTTSISTNSNAPIKTITPTNGATNTAKTAGTGGSPLDVLSTLGMMGALGGGNNTTPQQELFSAPKFDVASLTSPTPTKAPAQDIFSVLNNLNNRG